jgi:predicted nucleotide-binding protein
MTTQDDIDQQKTLLNIHRRNLAHYLKQASFHGEGNVPLGTLNGIDSERSEIRRIKRVLRNWNQHVEDHIDDEATTDAAGASQPSNTVQYPTSPQEIPSQQQTADPAFRYDVFISYSHTDEQWVEKTLLKTLEDAGLRVCIDFRDFLAGRAALFNMQDAVRQSRHTVLVVTEAWIRSEWTLFESLLASTKDPAGLRRRTIPLRLQPVELPDFISTLTWVDFARPERQANAWRQLFTSLGEPASVSTPTVAQSQPATPASGPSQAIGGHSPSDAADVFISYHSADKEWVRKQLLPLLEQQHELRAIIDYRDFEIGVPKLVNIENAVANSRHTLIVLTPDWVASEWNNFHGLLASSADPSGLQAKLMPLILRPAALPNRIKFLEPTDLTDPEEREIQLDRLMRSLKRSR